MKSVFVVIFSAGLFCTFVARAADLPRPPGALDKQSAPRGIGNAPVQLRAQPATTATAQTALRGDITLNVPVRLNNIHSSIGKAMVRCNVYGSGSTPLIGANAVEIPLSNGDYSGTLTVPIFAGVHKGWGSDRTDNPKPDPGLATRYMCQLHFTDRTGRGHGFCALGTSSSCGDAFWAMYRPDRPNSIVVEGNISTR